MTRPRAHAHTTFRLGIFPIERLTDRMYERTIDQTTQRPTAVLSHLKLLRRFRETRDSSMAFVCLGPTFSRQRDHVAMATKINKLIETYTDKQSDRQLDRHTDRRTDSLYEQVNDTARDRSDSL